jgi:hypothetical protein
LEDTLELHHACVGEQQRGIVARHEGRRFDMAVPPLSEVIDERLANIVCAHPVT